MGNVQTAPIPRVIPPLEFYFQDVSELRYSQNLGNTRFMKVAKAEHFDGPMVAKVFVFPDTFISDKFIREIRKIRKKISNSNYTNCLGFTKIFMNDKVAILCRPFHKDTLYERLSIRPFLIDVEKRWIAFQLLKALEQCKRADVVHGDIKSHNILISSSNWVHLTDFASFKPTFIPCVDFASFKPTFIPCDTPSSFTFFFNASRQNMCNVAPERFKRSNDYENFNTEIPVYFHDLTKNRKEEMDIFSVGCVLLELFTDGRRYAFNFAKLIDYCSLDDETAREYVETIVTNCDSNIPPEFQNLIKVMLEKNPTARKELYYQYKPFQNHELFPPIFESFLYQYMGEFRVKASLSHGGEHSDEHVVPDLPDNIITKLYVERQRFMPELEKDNHNSVILLITLITSNIRACRTIIAKMDAICLLKELSKISSEALIAERIVPYLVRLLSDPFVQVQTESVHVLTEIVSKFKNIPVEESRLFVDYIFPKMKELISNTSTSPMTKMAIASNLGILALTALKFLDEGIKHATDEGGVIGSGVEPNAKNEKQATAIKTTQTPAAKLPNIERSALNQTISEFYQQLITQDNNAVRQTVMEAENLDKLGRFFELVGTKINVVLMHMITVLNNKKDWRLITSFFKNSSIAARKSSKSDNSGFFFPLLQQGLQHNEEFVVLESLRCIYVLCSEQRLEKATVWELCKEFVPFIVHPNVWLRIATVDILKILDEIFPFADILCRLMPNVKPFLRENLIRLSDKAAIHECLVEPIPRAAWDLVYSYEHPTELIRKLQDNQTLDKLGGGRNASFLQAEDPPLKPLKISSKSAVDNIVRKLANFANEGEEGILEEKIIAFQPILEKKMIVKRPSTKSKVMNSILTDIDDRILKIFDLEQGIHRGDPKGTSLWRSDNEFSSYHNTESSGNEILNSQSKRKSKSNSILYNDSVHCLTSHTPVNYSKPEIRVVAHLHEHAEKVTKLSVHSNQQTFASSSLDRSVKLWTISQIPNKQPSAVTSTQTVPHPKEINCLQFMTDNPNHLLSGSEDGILSIYDVEENKFLSNNITVDPNIDGGFTKLYSVDHLIYALTAQSSIYCYDKRSSSSKNPVYKFDNIFHRRARNNYGYITSLTIDPLNQHWMALTSSTAGTKNIVLYDLRFLALEVHSWEHPCKKGLVLNSWPLLTSSAECTKLVTGFSREGEMSIWQLDGGEISRSHLLWPGTSNGIENTFLKENDEDLKYTQEHQTSAFAQSHSLDGFFTGDSQGALRFWSLTQPQRCNYLSGPQRPYLIPPLLSRQCTNTPTTFFQPPDHSSIIYRRVDRSIGSILIHENVPKKSPDSSSQIFSDKNYQKLVQVGEQHRDGITDISLIGNDYLTSSGRDGSIKVWKIFNTA
uniref:Non-specific serine/threonine protein kinase n=1 Tax=Panagrolaimus sp. PS1159 TaxID=55785 RepID=A0AC35FSA7_9BILA